MKRNTLNFVLDVLLAITALAMIATGLLIRWVLPPGSGEWRTLWGLGRHDWGDIHFWLAVTIATILLIHLALHWQWACTTTGRFFRRHAQDATTVPSALWRNVAGILILAFVLAAMLAFVAVANASVDEAGPRGAGHGTRHSPAQSDATPLLQGSMTLSETAKTYHLSEREVCDRLGISSQTSANERMGRLMRTHGMTISEAREKLQKPR